MYREINSTLSSEQYFKLDKQMFVMAKGQKESLCAIFDNFKSDVLLSFIEKVRTKFESQSVEFKLLGPSSLVNGASRVISGTGFREIKTVVRNQSFEVFYLADQNRLRVSKAEVVAEPVSREKKKIKVLIVDDSKTIRNLLNKMLSSDPMIEICAEASKPSEVESLIKHHQPDVMTLDIHMPEMTGVELLKKIGHKYNVPAIMVTSISMEEGPLVLEALENGAFDYIQKPDMKDISIVRPVLLEKIKEAAESSKTITNINKLGAKVVKDFNMDSLIVLGSSTGGTNAIKDILVKFPKNIPPMLIVQHIPPVFSKAFADRMNSLCPFTVVEAKNGDILEKNKVLVAPGGTQMKLVNQAGVLKVEINDDAPVNRFKPSVDYMFNSVVDACKKKHVISVILTGMGKDGARGMLNLKNAGALTIAQDEESSVVYGMPREAVEIGAAMAVEHKDDIAAKIGEFSWQSDKAAS
ncbi:chemotaxis response regulator protein-glutamate methylesterase [Bacteriovorax sp. Seq25_V]|uniref:protein-glutamate methylesterase/protein-glutamine glutaminase n=1 Tax=Bacteriovorax sp. Seq25_V TaxID=1201288 RepID=UPI00038A10C6|nr:chemotaxis response regulator protein-glutamate methylesterase [Bacteriovorax sp. Seq25_V]EQC46643.1 protein-glutamate methylesterase CheB [Bacteriovorax sp. Seq25_V]